VTPKDGERGPAAGATAPPGPWRLLGALNEREEQFFLVFAIFVGVFAGLAVVCFRVAIDWARVALLGSALRPGDVRMLLAPTLAGLAAGTLVLWLFPRARGSGVNQTKAALYVYDGRIPFSTVIGKFLTSSLAVGGGHSLGPEDPALQIGGGLASAAGRGLRLSRDRLRLVPSLGAAAGLAAAFNSPITAVLFVVEEVIGRWSAPILGPLVLSAVSGVTVSHAFLGAEPLFRVPAVESATPAELLAYAALGLLGGLFAVAFVKLVLHARPRLFALPPWTRPLQAAAAGALIGAIALRHPEVTGAGYEAIGQVLNGDHAWQLLAVLAALKLATTAASFSAGVPGGLFAPTLVMGAMLGGAVGRLQAALFPDLTGPIHVYVLVGMGTLFAGNLRAPMTSVFMILEITGNYGIVVPVMVSNTIAYLVSRAFQRAPLFDVLARQDGLELPSLEDRRHQTILRVEDAMRDPVDLLRPTETVATALSRIQGAPGEFFLVREDGGRWSGVSRTRLQALRDEGRGEAAVRSVVEASLPQLHPDHELESALRLVREWWPVVPVVHRADFDRLVGVLSLEDVLAAYRKGPAGGQP